MEVVLLLVFVAGDKPAAPVIKEFEALRGDWVVVSAERDGKKLASTEVDVIRITDQLPKGAEKRCDIYTFTVDPATSPKRLAGSVTGGEIKGEKLFAIYKLDGDKLTLCCDHGGTDYPAKMQAVKGDGRIAYNLERRKKK